MEREIFHKLLSVEEAKKRFYSFFKPKPLGVESVPLTEACGRVLGSDVFGLVDVPFFDRAAMDGYAVKAKNTFGAGETNPIKLRVVGRIAAGEKPSIKVDDGEAVEISTGAPIPLGADAVVMVEYTRREKDFVYVYKPISPNENVMVAGSDIKAGELLLRRGTILTAREIGLLAAIGFVKPPCFKKPKIAVFSTGAELVSPGKPLESGKIYDVNSYTICCSVRECGCEPIFLGIAEDNFNSIYQKLKEGLEISDAVIVSGGTSAGVGDILYRVVEKLGKPGIIVHGVLIKPGKPTLLAVVDKKPIFGLPGYPTSALMVFDLFVRPILMEMAGLDPTIRRRVLKVKVGEKIFASEGRRDFLPVNLLHTKDGLEAFSLPTGSGAITTLAKADGFIEIPENKTIVEKGEVFEVKLFSQEVKPSNLVFAGLACLGLDFILEILALKHPNWKIKIFNVGSSGGLTSLRRGGADFAGISLLDKQTGDYNLPFLEIYGIKNEAVLVRGYKRRHGIFVKKGNPKNIRGLDDFLREDVIMVNWSHGLEQRELLDFLFRKLAEKTGLDFESLTSKIKGYNFEVGSYQSCISAILDGRVDVGFGFEGFAKRYGLDFIPLTEDLYDFVFRVNRMNKVEIQSFLEILRSKDFKERVKERVEGILILKETGETVYYPKNL